jgi:tetratricopeptide (TPR) repeat protein
MPPTSPTERGNDPCLQIQVDLSAMLDGELDMPSVRRVMVHSDVCPSCRTFLEGIRSQVRLHRKLATVGLVGASKTRDADRRLSGDDGEPAEVDGVGVESVATQRLRQQLTDNRRRLAKILYELGRCFVLMGLSPDFSREVAKEPVPVPDMAMRGRNLLDEVARLDPASTGAEWVSAKDLFDGQLRSPDENMAKGQRLLTECLALQPDTHEARIYLGLVHYVRGQRSQAQRQFAAILQGTQDRLMRGYALLNLANIRLDEGDCDAAVELLLQMVESGIVHEQPRLCMTYFNLGLAYGMKGLFRECHHWFQRLHDEVPHKKNAVARELGRRSQFLHMLRSHPDAATVVNSFPFWFGDTAGATGGAAPVSHSARRTGS